MRIESSPLSRSGWLLDLTMQDDDPVFLSSKLAIS